MHSRRVQLLICAVLALLMGASATSAASTWTLGFKHEGLGRVRVLGAGGRYVTSYYLVYSVTNKTGEAQPLNLNFVLTTDTKKKSRDVGDIKTAKAVKAKAKGKKLLSRAELPRTIEDGKTVYGVATFGRLDPNADAMTVDVTGLRDTVVTRNGEDFFEKAAYRIQFSRKGDEIGADRDRVRLKKAKWVILDGPTPIR